MNAPISPWALDVAAAADTLAAAWARASQAPIVLFGAGGTGRSVLAALREAGIAPVCFADDTPAKQGTLVDGLPVHALDDAMRRAGANATVVVCVFFPTHAFAVTQRTLAARLPEATVFPFYTALWAVQGDRFSFYFFDGPGKEAARLATYRALLDKLGDDLSRETLEAHLRLRLLHDPSIGITPREDMPVPGELLQADGLTYLDAGAYDGDTLAVFARVSHGRFGRMIALEPDAANAARLETYRRSLPEDVQARVSILQKGLWREEGQIGFVSTGNMGAAIDRDAETRVEVTSLDRLLAGVKGPVFVKIDIEGAELEALAGARKAAAETRPCFGISVYHRPGDLADVFTWLEGTAQGYRYGLRCHGGDGTDLMLYAW